MFTGRVEIGLADLQVDDVPALRLERAGSGGGLESRLGTDTDHALCKLHDRHRTKGCSSRRVPFSDASLQVATTTQPANITPFAAFNDLLCRTS